MGVELFINGTQSGAIGKLTLFGDEPISLNIAANDVTDINKKNSVYSQAFAIQADKNNNELLNHIFNIGSDSLFDTRKKTPCFILNDDIQVFVGNLQLTKVNVKNKNIVSYDVVVYGELTDLLKSIGDGLVTDLDFSNLNHQFTVDNIVHSWTADTDTLGYYYPLIDYGYDLSANDLNNSIPNNSTWNGSVYATGGMDPFLFKPALSNKMLLDKIFASASFSYESDFLNSDIFKETIMPFNGDVKLANNDAYTDQFLFYVGTTGSVSFTQSYSYPATLLNPYFISTTGDLRNYQPRLADSSNPFYDIAGDFNTTTYKYVASQATVQSFVADISFKSGFTFSGLINSQWRVNWYRKLPGKPAILFYQDGFNWINNLPSGATQSVRSSTPKLNNPNSTNLYPVQQGEEIFYQIDIVSSNYQLIGWTFETTVISAQLYNNVYPDLVLGGTLFYNQFVPKNIKQVDFVKSIITMFNLVVIPDKNNPKKLKLIPRDTYYSTGEIKNWTNKLDVNSKIDVKFISEQQQKKIKLSYKEDKDFYNTDYKSLTNTVYGEYINIIDNEWIEGEKKIEVIFSPTPIDKVLGTTDVYAPKIAKRDEASGVYSRTDFNVRFLRKNKTLMSTQNELRLIGYTASNSYPYAGHLDHPTAPNLDYNFGPIDFAYYPELKSMTPNTLVDEYWKNYLDDISDKNSRLIKCKIYLTPDDIARFNYNDNIYLEGLTDDGGHYFIVNKITYVPTNNLPSEVELIKVNRKPTEKLPIYQIKNPKTIGAIRNIDVGKRNTLNSSEVVVTGANNYVGFNSGPSLISGNNNFVASESTATIFGNSNRVSSGATGSFIIGNNVTATEADTIYLSGRVVNSINYVQAGRNEILNPFSDTIINYRSGSRNSIRELGSNDIVQIISGGRDSIL